MFSPARQFPCSFCLHWNRIEFGLDQILHDVIFPLRCIPSHIEFEHCGYFGQAAQVDFDGAHVLADKLAEFFG